MKWAVITFRDYTLCFNESSAVSPGSTSCPAADWSLRTPLLAAERAFYLSVSHVCNEVSCDFMCLIHSIKFQGPTLVECCQLEIRAQTFKWSVCDCVTAWRATSGPVKQNVSSCLKTLETNRLWPVISEWVHPSNTSWLMTQKPGSDPVCVSGHNEDADVLCLSVFGTALGENSSSGWDYHIVQVAALRSRQEVMQCSSRAGGRTPRLEKWGSSWRWVDP